MKSVSRAGTLKQTLKLVNIPSAGYGWHGNRRLDWRKQAHKLSQSIWLSWDHELQEH